MEANIQRGFLYVRLFGRLGPSCVLRFVREWDRRYYEGGHCRLFAVWQEDTSSVFMGWGVCGGGGGSGGGSLSKVMVSKSLGRIMY